jgi:hypothetical protein
MKVQYFHGNLRNYSSKHAAVSQELMPGNVVTFGFELGDHL